MQNTLDEKALKNIAETVKEAEQDTTGEIASAVIGESDSYAVYELLASVFSSFILFLFGSVFFGYIEDWLSSKIWDYSTVHIVLFYGGMIFLLIFIFYLIFNNRFFDRILVPSRVLEEKVRHRALRHFAESGVYQTKDHSGLLIFVSLTEKRVEIVIDTGLKEKISQKIWDGIALKMTETIKSEGLEKAMIEAVTECGQLLKKHFPGKSENPNELADATAVLEG